MAAEDNDDIFQEDDNNDVDNKKVVIDPIKVRFKRRFFVLSLLYLSRVYRRLDFLRVLYVMHAMRI